MNCYMEQASGIQTSAQFRGLWSTTKSKSYKPSCLLDLVDEPTIIIGIVAISKYVERGTPDIYFIIGFD